MYVVGPYRCCAWSVTVGSIFLALVTFMWGWQRTYSVGTFSFSWCTVDGARVYGTTKEALATGHAIPVTGQFLPLVAMTSDPTLLRLTGWFGPEYEFQNGRAVFLDAQMDANGRWLIPVGTLSTFVKTAKVPNVLSCVQSHTPVWHIPACGPRKQHNFLCSVERPLLWEACTIMWQCICRRERW